MAALFKLSYLPYLLVAVGLVLIFLWARSRGPMKEGFDNSNSNSVQGASENPWKFNMYYVDWCPHCHHAKPEFEKIGSTMTIGGKTVTLKAIEAEKNPEAVQGLKISGYPTFVLYDAEGKLVKDYDGPRKEAGFRSFLEDNLNMQAERMSQ